jgi:ArsR family metal-binding transcriptional regulator
MLIDSYDLELFTPPCEPGAERFSARARLGTDVSPVLPYLNAVLPGAIYQPNVPVLTWKQAQHSIAVYPRELLVSNTPNRVTAQEELEKLISFLNETWQRRREITPSDKIRRRPTPMELFKLLPQTNCKACGEPTCFSFALKLSAGQQTLEACPPLFDPVLADPLAALREIMRNAPAQ